MIKFKSLTLWQILAVVIRADEFGNILDDHHLQNTMREKPKSVDITLTTSESTTKSEHCINSFRRIKTYIKIPLPEFN
jgi:hypothetical protein